ncbi:MAG: TetR/AcrR family transcriptional regulator [Actinomycetota bacterium]|nr:TetR/AcrR family transcriptional regulator [Actinomycetota bacterium]
MSVSLRSRRRNELVGAAARLFSERGYHGTSMQDLGDALGLLRGSLYAHIGSKQDLLFDVVDQGARRFLERGRQALLLDAPFPQRLRDFLVGHVEVAIEQLDAGRVFLNEWRYLDDSLQQDIMAKRDAYEDMVRGILHDGVEAGEMRSDVDISLAARLVLSCGNWIYSWYRLDGELSPSAVGEAFADMIIGGLHQKEAA